MGKGKKKQDVTSDAAGQKKDRALVVDLRCLEDLQYWAGTGARVLTRIFTLIEAVLREPFCGIGKPEPLKHLAARTWSRRITGEHRLVYVVFDDRIVLIQARLHY